jgi:NAD(P)-dependent dehydrogenase (short-subunit alcohol dehydrogenase family)
VALALARRGADLAFSYNRSRDDVERAAEAVRALGRRATVCTADVTKAADCEALVAHVADTLGRLDVLVHMASRYAKVAFDALTERDWDESIAVDARAGFLCARAAVPHMRAAGGGRIVFFADWLSRSGRPHYPGYLPYYVAKGAVGALTEALALELAGDQILVNAVAPGPILAPPDLSDEERRAVERETPVGRWGGEDAIAHIVLALIETDFITGETVRADGGRHLR